MFLQVCVCPQGVSAPLHAGIHFPGTSGRHPPRADTPLGRHPPWADTPSAQCMLGYGQQAGGTHPTGMHSCSRCEWAFSVMIVYWARIDWRHFSGASLLTELVIGTN